MAQHASQIPPSADVVARGHEPTSVSLKGYVLFVGVFIGAALVIHLIVWWTMIGFASLEPGVEEDRAQSPLARSVRHPVPPQPWLQPSPAQGDSPRQPWEDTTAFTAQENRILDSYGTVDEKAGIVRIPIQRAMQILAQRGLPTTAPAGGGP